ncbi:MAG: N-acetyltransferase, partial [Acidaminobacteraceae bacterium]
TYTILLEIDPPDDDISIRRLSFYNRLGFKNNDITHCIPSFQKNLGNYILKLLSYGRLITDDEYSLFYDSLMDSIFKYSE